MKNFWCCFCMSLNAPVNGKVSIFPDIDGPYVFHGKHLSLLYFPKFTMPAAHKVWHQLKELATKLTDRRESKIRSDLMSTFY